MERYTNGDIEQKIFLGGFNHSVSDLRELRRFSEILPAFEFIRSGESFNLILS